MKSFKQRIEDLGASYLARAKTASPEKREVLMDVSTDLIMVLIDERLRKQGNTLEREDGDG
jgi:hypothetical protein